MRNRRVKKPRCCGQVHLRFEFRFKHIHPKAHDFIYQNFNFFSNKLN